MIGNPRQYKGKEMADNKQNETMVNCRCWKCGKRYQMPKRDVNAWGRDYDCGECLDRAHRKFVRDMAAKGIKFSE